MWTLETHGGTAAHGAWPSAADEERWAQRTPHSLWFHPGSCAQSIRTPQLPLGKSGEVRRWKQIHNLLQDESRNPNSRRRLSLSCHGQGPTEQVLAHREALWRRAEQERATRVKKVMRHERAQHGMSSRMQRGVSPRGPPGFGSQPRPAEVRFPGQ